MAASDCEPLVKTNSTNVSDRFWSKVFITSVCWEWKGSKKNGYGSFWNGERRIGAHRWAWENLVGPIPVGLEIDHLCRNRSCVNPDHLEPVTHKENVRRGAGGWNTASKMSCPQGHPYAGENLMTSQGHRYCRTCARKRGRESRTHIPRKEITHCPQGHEYNQENTGIKKNGHRWCRACNKERYTAHPLPKVTECPRGHPYSGDNLNIDSSGYQRCRECERERSSRRTAERRVAKVKTSESS